MIDREAEVPEELRIRFRIGVNIGDVIVDEHDIFGDGVNVTARLEGFGEQKVKNIVRPVRVSRIGTPLGDPRQ